MKIKVTMTGTTPSNQHRTVEWPADWPVPRVGDEVDLPNAPEISHVRVVEWNPEGDEDDPTPFCYVVLGPRRRME